MHTTLFKGRSQEGEEYAIVDRQLNPDQLYPTAAAYQWGEFAGFVIEYGGYGDVSLVNPYTGRVLLIHDGCGPADSPQSTTDILHKLADVGGQAGFFDHH